MGAKVVPYKTYQLRLSDDLNEMWKKAINKKVRNIVRKAWKNNIVCREFSNHWSDYDEIFNSAPIRQGRRMRVSDGTPRLCPPSTSKAQMHEIGAFRNDKLIGVSRILDYRSIADFATFLTHRKYWNLGLSEFLMWSAIQDACNNGIEVLEYGVPASSGMNHFREQFGFRLKDSFVILLPTTRMDRVRSSVLLRIQKTSLALEGSPLKSPVSKVFNKIFSNALYNIGF